MPVPPEAESSSSEDLSISSSSQDLLSSSSLEIPVPESSSSGLPFIGGTILFSEVDPINTVYEDHEGGDAGWVELFNTSSESVNLKGLALTNSLSEPSKWIFGDAEIPPLSFMLVYLSGKNLPDFEAPHDSVSLVGKGCWTWTDAQADPPGESYAKGLYGHSNLCFKEGVDVLFGSRMRYGENSELGWKSIAAFVGTGSSDPEDVLDISATNEILLHAFITKDRKVSFRLAQTGLDDWKGFEMVFEGTGDSSTVYHAILPTGKTLPDLKKIYGTRMSPEDQEKQEVTVKAFSYIARNRGHEPHASFKIKNKPGSLYLVKPGVGVIDSVAYPDVPPGKTWSLGSDASDILQMKWGFASPSPNGYTETTVVAERSPALDTLSEMPPSGFYGEPFAVSFAAENFVRCEIGGTAPSENSPITTSLVVESSKTIRCASFVPGKMAGKILNRTYVFESLPKVPVVFLVADPKSLFSPDSGIYMEGYNAEAKEPHYGANYWEDKEIPVFVEFFENGTNRSAFAKDAGLKIFGNYSRQSEKKSVSITFREKYGDKRLDYPLFPDFPSLTKFKVFVLRNNGSNFQNDYIRDRLASSISEGLGVDYQRGRGAIVYYNGEYFGIHNIRERSTEYYFETHYDYNPEDIDLLKADNSASAGSSVDYNNLMSWMETHDMSDDASLAYVSERMDIDNFMNYMHTEMFADNRDWPSNNLKKWRCNNPATKWKWFIYDTDFGFANGYSKFTNNIFEFATAEDGDSWPNGPESTFLLRKLLENESFKVAFVNRMATLLSMNFESSRVLSRINSMMAEIESEIVRDQARWGHNSSRMSRQLSTIKSFAMERPNVILDELRSFFNLDNTVPVTLSVKGGGSVLVHGLRLDTSPMTINFFSNTAVLVTAVPEAGGVWSGWSDGVTSASRVIYPGEISSLTAVFK